MNEELISVIVPVYNVENYLRKCIDSIIKQTYHNLEIIVVDDGSTDNSGRICNEYLEVDHRIKVYHKKNGGLSDARNFGITKSKGNYIGFVDSDDFIKEDMYEVLYKALKKHDADVSMCRVIDCYGTIPKFDNTKSYSIVLDSINAIKQIMEANEVSVHAVSKLYKKELFQKVQFEKGRSTEDGIIMVELFSYCQKIAYINSIEYYYIHRENSITTSKFTLKNYDVIYAYKKNYEIIKEKYPEIIDVARMRLCWAYFNVLDLMINSNVNIDYDIVKYLRENCWFIITNKNFKITRKISTFALKVSVELYRIIVQKFYKKKQKNILG